MKNQSNYNDGFIYVYEEKEKKSNFAAPVNVTGKEQMREVMKLAYEETYKREKDLEFAQSHNKSLSMKVKTRLHEKVKKYHKIVVADTLYDIFEIDYDRKKQEMYLYMEEVRKNVK